MKQNMQNHSSQTKPPIKIGESEIVSKNDISNRLGARDKTADIFNCIWCSKKFKIEDLRNEISMREFKISGFCQKCQDATFGED